MKVEYVSTVHSENTEADVRKRAKPEATEADIQAYLRKFWRYRATQWQLKGCCEPMQKCLDEQLVQFSPEGAEEPSLHLLLTDGEDTDYDYERVTLRPITYCPFCAEKVECAEVKRVRQVKKVVEKMVEEASYTEVELPLEERP